jgi:hypothetical protein
MAGDAAATVVDMKCRQAERGPHLKPVRLPPGFASLATKPCSIQQIRRRLPIPALPRVRGRNRRPKPLQK